MTTPRGIRNNNPGNIVKSGIAWQGKIVGPDERFETFATPFYGIRALASLLITYDEKHGLNTVRGIINRWAPPIENNTSAYVSVVAAALGVHPDTIIYVRNLDTMRRLVVAIIQHENGQQPYPSGLIGAAIGDALGIVQKSSIVEPETPKTSPIVEPRTPMPILALLSAFGPLLAQMIPAVSKLLNPNPSEVAGRNLAAAETVLSTIVAASGQPNIQAAVESMTADPALVEKVAAAVVSEPSIMAILEVGGGIQSARAADVAATQADRPFWFSPAFWISIVLLVMPFMLLADVFYVHPGAYDGNLRTQIVTGVLAIVMIVGGYFLGSSQGSQKKDDILASKGNV